VGSPDQRTLAEKDAVRVRVIGQVAVHRLLFAAETPHRFGEKIWGIQVENQIAVAIIGHLQMVTVKVLVSEDKSLFDGGQDTLYNRSLIVVAKPEAGIVRLDQVDEAT